MKQKYVRPEVFYESFQLSQHVAACRWDIHQAEGSCEASFDPNLNGISRDPFFTAFTDDIGTCTFRVEGNSVNGIAYCYTTGAMEDRLFNS